VKKINSNRQISILSNDTFKDFVFHVWFIACQAAKGLAKSSLGMTATLATKKNSPRKKKKKKIPPKKKKKKILSYPPPPTSLFFFKAKFLFSCINYTTSPLQNPIPMEIVHLCPKKYFNIIIIIIYYKRNTLWSSLW